jgi:hypothetical protein
LNAPYLGVSFFQNLKFTDTKDKNMKENKCFDTNTYLRFLLIAPAIALLGLTACSTADGTAKHNDRGAFADIPPRAYPEANPKTKNRYEVLALGY